MRGQHCYKKTLSFLNYHLQSTMSEFFSTTHFSSSGYSLAHHELCMALIFFTRVGSFLYGRDVSLRAGR